MSEVKRDWKDIVKDSEGGLIFLPEKFIPEAKEWDGKRLEFADYINEAAKKEVHTRIALENVILAAKNYLADNGMKEIWSCDVGFETNALKEGLFILTVSKQQK